MSDRLFFELFMLNKQKISFKIPSYSSLASILFKLGEKNKGDDEGFVVFIDINSKFRRDLLTLKKKNLIKIKKIDKNLIKAALLPDGVLEFFKLKMVQSEELFGDEVCMVVFDIPEKFKKQRALMRKFLIDCVFLRIQKSVWIARFDYVDLLTDLFVMLEMKNWVRVFWAKEK